MYALPLFFRVEHDASDPPLQQPLWLMLSRHSFPLSCLGGFFFSQFLSVRHVISISLCHISEDCMALFIITLAR